MLLLTMFCFNILFAFQLRCSFKFVRVIVNNSFITEVPLIYSVREVAVNVNVDGNRVIVTSCRCIACMEAPWLMVSVVPSTSSRPPGTRHYTTWPQYRVNVGQSRFLLPRGMTVGSALINDKCFAAFVSVNYPFETRPTAAAVHLSTRILHGVAPRPATAFVGDGHWSIGLWRGYCRWLTRCDNSNVQFTTNHPLVHGGNYHLCAWMHNVTERWCSTMRD